MSCASLLLALCEVIYPGRVRIKRRGCNLPQATVTCTEVMAVGDNTGRILATNVFERQSGQWKVPSPRLSLLLYCCASRDSHGVAHVFESGNVAFLDCALIVRFMLDVPQHATADFGSSCNTDQRGNNSC